MNKGIITKGDTWIGIVGALLIVYPNLICIPWKLEHTEAGQHLGVFIGFHVVRWLYFACMIMVIYQLNVKRTWTMGRRIAVSIAVAALAYGLFALVSHLLTPYGAHDRLGSVLILQFVVVCGLGILMGKIALLRQERLRMATEVEQLRTENLQSQCAALANQISPHFFFNSLSGIAALVRGGDSDRTLEYIDELSDVFRYTLQSGNKGMVTLGEELDFANSFRYVLEMRYAGKLTFDIHVTNQQKAQYILPVLTLLPLIENVIVHNRIDSTHPMEVRIDINEREELAVSNPVNSKQQPPPTNGTGLKNLSNRLNLMAGRRLRIEDDGQRFTVFVPLK